MSWLLVSCGILCGQLSVAGPATSPTLQNSPEVPSSPRSVQVVDVEPNQPRLPVAESETDADLGNLAGLSGVLEALIRTHLPNHYEEKKHWGKTKEFWSGVKVSLDGLRIDSEPRHKRVNHGQWKRYRIDLTQPNEHLALSVEDVRETDAHRLHFEVVTNVPLHVLGEIAQWERGVKLGSLSSEADAIVRFRAGVDLGIEFDARKFPPDVILRPAVTEAHVELISFRLRRVGQFDGPLMKPLGQGLREVLEEKLEDTNASLVVKLNRQIEKKQEKLRLSAADWLTRKFAAKE